MIEMEATTPDARTSSPGEKREPQAPKEPARHGAAGEPPVGLAEVKDFVRSLVAAEKNYQLFPVEGKVVQQSLRSFQASLAAAQEAAAAILEIQVAPSDLLYEGEVVYHDAMRGKSLADLLHKDSIRKVVFLEDPTLQELADFVDCFKKARRSSETEEDFGTLFWQRDFTRILVDTTQRFTTEEAVAWIPIKSNADTQFDLERFQIGEEEEKRLRELASNRIAEEGEGDRSTELSEEEIGQIRELSAAEEGYFPLCDFADALLDMLMLHHDPKELQASLKLLQATIFGLVENFEFKHARELFTRLASTRHPGLTDPQRLALAEMLRSLGDKATMQVLAAFLKENSQLARSHDVFELMKTLGREMIPHLCELLSSAEPHIPAIADVLVHLGTGCGDIFSQYLLSPNAQVARALVQVILRTDKHGAIERIALALKHPDENVWLYAAKTLFEHGDAKAGPFFLQMLKGTSPKLVSLAIQFFAKTPHAAAYREIQAIVRTRGFRDLDGQRQDQCFMALMLADPERATSFIARSVLRWSRSLGKQSVRKKAAALRALAVQPKPQALAVLRRFARKPRSPLGPVARRILDVLERSPGSTAAPIAEVAHA